MKSTGIVRKIDGLGRIVIPVELRTELKIGEKDPLEVFTDENMIVLKKYAPHCVFCGEVKDVVTFKGQMVCPSCVKQMGRLYDR